MCTRNSFHIYNLSEPWFACYLEKSTLLPSVLVQLQYLYVFQIQTRNQQIHHMRKIVLLGKT